MLYEELVATLRDHNAVLSVATTDKAADAIEELSQLVSFYESAADGYWADLCRIRSGG
jgi:hypothetical protein